MSTETIFRRIAKRFENPSTALKASPAGRILHLDAAPTAKPSKLGGVRVACDLARFKVKWQLSEEIVQTPSNLM